MATEAKMQIETSTDSSIQGREMLAAHVEGVVENALSRFSDRITRVEVHLSDVNKGKGGSDDKRCMMEVRLEGRQPIAVTDHAPTLEQAIAGAAGKLKRSIETVLGRENTLKGLRDHR
jgi:ribosome-associated translation inhibitor RaiA